MNLNFKATILDGKLKIIDQNFINHIAKFKENDDLVITVEKRKKTRTNQQNKALHLYFSLLAEALNDAGFDMRKVIRDGIEIQWTPETIKEYLWRPLQEALINKKSSTQLTTAEIDKIWEPLNKTIGERTGIYIPFPCEEKLMNIDY